MHRRVLLLPLLLPALACPCPPIDGEDGNLRLRSCELNPDAPIQASSVFTLEIDAEGDRPGRWTSSDPAVLTVEEDDPLSPEIVAASPGASELTVETGGVVDRFPFEVVRADHAVLVDPFTAIVEAQLEADPTVLVGDLPVPPVGDTIRVTQGDRVAIQVDLLTDAGALISWTDEALVGLGSIGDDAQDSAHWVQNAGAGSVVDDEGTVLVEVDVVEVADDAGAAIDLGAWPDERTDALSEDEEGPVRGSYLRAVVTDADGAMIHQPVIAWTVAGPGVVRTFREEEHAGIADRTDLAVWLFEEDDFGRWENGRACVTATIDTADGPASKSAWFTPDEVEVTPGDDCDGRAGCACSSAAPLDPSGLLLAPVLAVALRLRRRPTAPAFG